MQRSYLTDACSSCGGLQVSIWHGCRKQLLQDGERQKEMGRDERRGEMMRATMKPKLITVSQLINVKSDLKNTPRFWEIYLLKKKALPLLMPKTTQYNAMQSETWSILFISSLVFYLWFKWFLFKWKHLYSVLWDYVQFYERLVSLYQTRVWNCVKACVC